MAEGGPDVGYTLKEVIEKLDRKIDAMFTVISLKADRADVTALGHRVDAVERRLDVEQTVQKTAGEVRKERTEHWRWLVPTLVAVASLIVSVVLIIH